MLRYPDAGDPDEEVDEEHDVAGVQQVALQEALQEVQQGVQQVAQQEVQRELQKEVEEEVQQEFEEEFHQQFEEEVQHQFEEEFQQEGAEGVEKVEAEVHYAESVPSSRSSGGSSVTTTDENLQQYLHDAYFGDVLDPLLPAASAMVSPSSSVKALEPVCRTNTPDLKAQDTIMSDDNIPHDQRLGASPKLEALKPWSSELKTSAFASQQIHEYISQVQVIVYNAHIPDVDLASIFAPAGPQPAAPRLRPEGATASGGNIPTLDLARTGSPVLPTRDSFIAVAHSSDFNSEGNVAVFPLQPSISTATALSDLVPNVEAAPLQATISAAVAPAPLNLNLVDDLQAGIGGAFADPSASQDEDGEDDILSGVQAQYDAAVPETLYELGLLT
jgi:hypothetical protein